MLTDIIKGIIANSPVYATDVDGVEHIFYGTLNGSIFDIIPSKGITNVIQQNNSFNFRFYITYSHVSNCYYILYPNELIEYNAKTYEINVYNYTSVSVPSVLWSERARYPSGVYVMNRSIDGHIYWGGGHFHHLTGYVRFNVITKQFDEFVAFPDKEFSHLQGRRQFYAFKIDFGSLAGVYSTYLFSDDYEDIYPLIKSEAAANGLTYTAVRYPYLHVDDRDPTSTTRRVGAYLNGQWRFQDVKNPATWIRSPYTGTEDLYYAVFGNGNSWVWTDQGGATVNRSAWTWNRLSSYDADTGFVPVFNSTYDYGIPLKIGRFIYIGNYYMADKQYFYTLPLHPTTGEVIYPKVVDKAAGFINNQAQAYRINFNGDFGFSTSDEFVLFITDGNTPQQWGFVRPDNNTFQLYNIVTNPSGYSRTAINPNDKQYFDNSFMPAPWGVAMSEVTIGDTSCFVTTDPTISNTAISVGNEANIKEGDITDLSFDLFLNRNDDRTRVKYTVKNLLARVSNVGQAIEVSDNKAIIYGRQYSGIVAINIISDTAYTVQKILPAAISFNGMKQISPTKAFAYGYLGVSFLIDFEDWNAITTTRISVGSITEPLHIFVKDNAVFWSGAPVRQAGYYNGFRLSYMNILNNSVGTLQNLPNRMNAVVVPAIRAQMGLGAETYSDVAAEAGLQTYLTTTGKTRAQALNEFVETCRYKTGDFHVDGNNIFFGLEHDGIFLLRGIRFETTPGSGVWVDSNYKSGGLCEIAIANTTDAKTLTAANFKFVKLTGYINEDYQRIAGTQDHIFCFEGGRYGRVIVYTKASLLAAADGAEVTALAEFNVDHGAAGGFGDNVYFNSTGTQLSNTIAETEDAIYITAVTDTGTLPRPCIYKVTTSGLTVYAVSSNVIVRTLSVKNDRMLISQSTEVKVVDNYASQTLPITL